MKESIVILAGGGPAPGINTVISTVAKTFLKDGYRVLGLNDGYKNLFQPNPDVVEPPSSITSAAASMISSISSSRRQSKVVRR